MDWPQNPKYRIGALPGFIPLNDDASTLTPTSTRGQRLSGLISSRSSNSLFTLGHQRRDSLRRRGSFRSTHSGEGLENEENEDQQLSQSFIRRMTHGSTTPPEIDSRRMSLGPEILLTPQMRSMRLIGKSNPRYHWHQYYKSEDELKKMKKPIRQYYERNNFLITQYVYIDKLLDSSLPHDLIQEYNRSHYTNPMGTISEEASSVAAEADPISSTSSQTLTTPIDTKVKRTPKNLYKLPEETSPLLGNNNLADEDEDIEAQCDCDLPDIKYDEDDEAVEFNSPIVTSAIYVNLTANILLLAGKIAVIVLTSSLSVLASLVDAALDFLSTAIVWTTTLLISRPDQYAYPVGRRRLEPVGVLVFSIIMITSFFQVSLECFQRLLSPDHSVVQLGIPAIAIMLATVVIKGACWFYCRLINNSSVQALAQDAATDVVFNIFSIIFPLVGYWVHVWWLDALGGLLLSFYVIYNWSRTSSEHVRNLCGAAATADERNVLLYLTMRFAKTIKSIQGLQAYHAGDKLNVEVDIVLDEHTSLRDSHDLGESLQYVLESVPTVDRAFVHTDYARWNLPSHMNQQAD